MLAAKELAGGKLQANIQDERIGSRKKELRFQLSPE
jgi:hypothetical protein